MLIHLTYQLLAHISLLLWTFPHHYSHLLACAALGLHSCWSCLLVCTHTRPAHAGPAYQHAPALSSGQYILTKGIIQQEEITIINIYSLSSSTEKFIQQVLLNIKDKINIDTISKDFNTQLTQIDLLDTKSVKSYQS